MIENFMNKFYFKFLFLLIAVNLGICQPTLSNSSAAIITRKLMHKNGLKEFTVQKNIKGNECACACYCSLPNSEDAMAQMRQTNPNVDDMDLAKLDNPFYKRRFEIEKMISGNQCKCSCLCAEPEIVNDDDSQIPMIEPKTGENEEEIGTTKNGIQNEGNGLEDKKLDLEEFTESTAKSSSSSIRENEPNLTTISLEKASTNSTKTDEQNLATISNKNGSSSSTSNVEPNLTSTTFEGSSRSRTDQNEPTIVTTSNFESSSSSDGLFESNFAKTSSSLLERSTTRSAADNGKISSNTNNFGTTSSSKEADEPNSATTLSEGISSSSASSSSTTAGNVAIFTTNTFESTLTSPSDEKLANTNSGWRKIDSNEANDEKALTEKRILESNQFEGTTTPMEFKGSATTFKGTSSMKAESDDRFKAETTTFSAKESAPIFYASTKNAENSNDEFEKITTPIEGTASIEPSNAFETTTAAFYSTILSNKNDEKLEAKTTITAENSGQQSSTLDGKGDEKLEVKKEENEAENAKNVNEGPSKSAERIGEKKLEGKEGIIGGKNTTKSSFITSSNFGNLNGKIDKTTAENVENATQQFSANFFETTSPSSPENENDDTSTFDPLFKARVANLLNKLKVKLFKMRQMEQEENAAKNGTENAKKNGKGEKTEEKQLFFQHDQKNEEKNGGNQSVNNPLEKAEKNGTFEENRGKEVKNVPLELSKAKGLKEEKNKGEEVKKSLLEVPKENNQTDKAKEVPLKFAKANASNEKNEVIVEVMNVSRKMPEENANSQSTSSPTGLQLTTLLPPNSAFVTSDGSDDLDDQLEENQKENGIKTTPKPFDPNEGLNTSKGANEWLNTSPNNVFPSTTPFSPLPLEEETTVNPLFKARVANLLNRLKEQLFRLRAAQQQKAGLNGTNLEGNNSQGAIPLANLLNASSNHLPMQSNGKMLSKSEQMLEGLQQKLEQLQMGAEEGGKKAGNRTKEVMESEEQPSKTSPNINKATTISSSLFKGPPSSPSSSTISSSIKDSIATVESPKTIQILLKEIPSTSSSSTISSPKFTSISPSKTPTISAKISRPILTQNESKAATAFPSKIQIPVSNSTSAKPNSSQNSLTKTSVPPKLSANQSFKIILTPKASNSSTASSSKAQIDAKTTSSISSSSTLATPNFSQNILVKTSPTPIIGQSKNLAEPSALNRTKNSLEDEEGEGNFAFVTETPEVPKIILATNERKEVEELNATRPIVLVLNETANFGEKPPSNMTEKKDAKLEEMQKNESKNADDNRLFPLTNDFLIDVPPKIVQNGKEDGEEGKKGNGENKDDGKMARVILLPAPPQGRALFKATPMPTDAPKANGIEQNRETLPPVSAEEPNWPSLITIREGGGKNAIQMEKNGKNMGQVAKGSKIQVKKEESSKNASNNEKNAENLIANKEAEKSQGNSPNLSKMTSKSTETTNSPGQQISMHSTIPSREMSILNGNKGEMAKQSQNWREQNEGKKTTTTKMARRKFVAPQAQNLIERLEQARKLREEQVKLEMMEAIRQEQIGTAEPDPQLAERRREIEQRLLQLAQAERLHREMLEAEMGTAGEKRRMDDENIHSSSSPVSPIDCAPVRRFLRLFRISDPRQWIDQNCQFARRHFPNASCPQIGALLSQCLEEEDGNEQEEK